jgi:hypothetical protein
MTLDTAPNFEQAIGRTERANYYESEPEPERAQDAFLMRAKEAGDLFRLARQWKFCMGDRDSEHPKILGWAYGVAFRAAEIAYDAGGRR